MHNNKTDPYINPENNSNDKDTDKEKKPDPDNEAERESNPDLERLARQAVDLWQTHITALINEPEPIANFIRAMALVGTAGTKAWMEVDWAALDRDIKRDYDESTFTPEKHTPEVDPDSESDKTAYEYTEGNNNVPPSRATSAGTASGASGGELADLSRRITEIERRLDALETKK